MRVNFKMAPPHGDRRRNLNTGFTDFATSEAFKDAQVRAPKSHVFEFDDGLDSTSSAFHSSLEPSILSIFEDSSTAAEKVRIDEESEASLLSAFSEMLDSVIEDTLSPFDRLPESNLFAGHRHQESKDRLHCLESEAAPRVSRSFTPSNSKVASLFSDRQLRPRLHRRPHLPTIQRSDGEEEDLGETQRRGVRIFCIESDPKLCEDEQQDRFVTMSLVDLVRHMHPYSLRAAVDKKVSLRHVEEDVFVDVVGDDTEEMPLGMPMVSHPSDSGSEQTVHLPHSPEVSNTLPNPKVFQEGMLKICSPNCSDQKDGGGTAQRVHDKLGSSRRKKVRFAPELASIHIYQVEDEAYEDDVLDASSSENHTNYLRMTDNDSQIVSTEAAKKLPFQNGDVKLKTLSLQEYRLLRQKAPPMEERKTDYRTKWPSVPETPKELPLIPCIPGYNSSQVNVHMPSSHAKTLTSGAVAKSRRKLQVPRTLHPKQYALVKKPVQAVDPPNPVTLSLQSSAKILASSSTEKKAIRQNFGKSQLQQIQTVSNSVSQEKPLMVSFVESPCAKDEHTKCSLTNSGVVKHISTPSSPVTVIPVQVSQGSLPHLQKPETNHSTDEKRQDSTGEIGIEASDVTSLLEQFETQGFTPPATPPHQIWKASTPVLKAKKHEAAKPSPNKTIQIIEPKPLPPSKIQSKPKPSFSIPAPSMFIAFIDHDYCSTQDLKLCKKRALSDVYIHNRPPQESRNHNSHMPMDNRTCCEAEHLSGSVLLSPECSPCRLEARRTSEYIEAESHSCSSCSPSPPARGRARTRYYRRRYHHSDSSSVSSSRSPSCSSSASSCSPPRKRYSSWHTESSSDSSSRSSSRSLSPSPIQRHRCHYSRSRSRSFTRSQSHSRSPQPDWKQKCSSWKRAPRREYRHLSRREHTRRVAKQKAIEERRVVYVGRIRGTMTKDELRERFALFGKIEDCTIHLRNPGDNYGFITYCNTDDAFAAIEKGTKLRQPDELPFDICFGGRRQFCQSDYMDLDSNRDMDPAPKRSKNATLDFDTLLKQAQRGIKT